MYILWLVPIPTLQVYVTSLCSTAPVHLDSEAVMKETLILNNTVLTVGSCNFRFVYRDGVFSPLREDNGARTPQIVSELVAVGTHFTMPSTVFSRVSAHLRVSTHPS